MSIKFITFQPQYLSGSQYMTQAGVPYTYTYKHRSSYLKSTLKFINPAKAWKCVSAARQKRENLEILLTRLQEALYEDLAV